MAAVLRRADPQISGHPIQVQGLCLDPASHRVTINDQPVDMGPTEYRLLEFFLTHQERAYTRSQLLDHVWGGNVYVEERTVDVHIRRLRKALTVDNHENLVQTVRGGALSGITIGKIDGATAIGSDGPLGAALTDAGFHTAPQGLRLRR